MGEGNCYGEEACYCGDCQVLGCWEKRILVCMEPEGSVHRTLIKERSKGMDGMEPFSHRYHSWVRTGVMYSFMTLSADNTHA